MVDVDVRVLSHLKEELALAVGKLLRVISTIMLFKKTVRPATKELKGTSHFKYFIHCYVALSNVI